MKKLLTVLIIIIAIIFCVLGLSACKSKSEAIVGDWYRKTASHLLWGEPTIWTSSDKLTFNKDGTMSVTDTENNVTVSENYSWSYDKKGKQWVIKKYSHTYYATIDKEGTLWIDDKEDNTTIAWNRKD